MKSLLLGATALTLCAGFSSAAYADFTLNILHINDFHSRFDPITDSDSNCDAETDAAGECFGGIARLKTIIAVLHHIQVQGRLRLLQPDGLRRGRYRQS